MLVEAFGEFDQLLFILNGNTYKFPKKLLLFNVLITFISSCYKFLPLH